MQTHPPHPKCEVQFVHHMHKMYFTLVHSKRKADRWEEGIPRRSVGHLFIYGYTQYMIFDVVHSHVHQHATIDSALAHGHL